MSENKTETIEVPHFEGFRCVGLKVLESGDYYLGIGGDLKRSIGSSGNFRIVYEKLPQKRHIFEETGDIRSLNHGDLYFDHETDLPSIWTQKSESVGSYRILRKVDE